MLVHIMFLLCIDISIILILQLLSGRNYYCNTTFTQSRHSLQVLIYPEIYIQSTILSIFIYNIYLIDNYTFFNFSIN